MNKLRYADEKYLCEYDLDVELFKKFDLRVEDLVPLRSVYLLITDKGKRILKKIENTEDIKFITTSLDYIREGFSDILNFVKAGDGNYYVKWNDGIYCVMELIEGRECCCANPLDVNMAATALAKYHNASLGLLNHLRNIDTLDVKNNLFKMPDYFRKAREELKNIEDMVITFKNKNEFDELFLSTINEQIANIDKAIVGISGPEYLKSCNDESKIVLCHNDLAYHNIILAKEKAYFIDFEYSLIDIRVHDLCNFIIKSIKNFGYDLDKCNEIIRSYESINKLDKEELNVLYSMMIFPNDYYNLVSNYYYKKKKWSYEAFLSKFKGKAVEEADKKEFLDLFKSKYL
ncbi:CotS family spore coat protein [Clostridium sp. 'White wine YQ']|uniref:CotS family spore coat protein n=1 Tax=Clostridium sp. 'White wine YQ' TaxID=3027474 RepID=UPI0023650D2A|nr:CotS family spore coat protein [Clostridium sp. 'White wine YQ']MDD7792665.1 CotS family spore coat protein [Clostridium sp. 'White wine YQ']